MYTPISALVVYTPSFGLGLQFDLTAFQDLVIFSVKGVRQELDAFTNAGKGKADKYEFAHTIGIGMEIIHTAVFLYLITKGEAKINKETRTAIKSIVLELNEILYKLGQNDSDFCTDFATQRVRTADELFGFVKEKW